MPPPLLTVLGPNRLDFLFIFNNYDFYSPPPPPPPAARGAGCRPSRAAPARSGAEEGAGEGVRAVSCPAGRPAHPSAGVGGLFLRGGGVLCAWVKGWVCVSLRGGGSPRPLLSRSLPAARAGGTGCSPCPASVRLSDVAVVVSAARQNPAVGSAGSVRGDGGGEGWVLGCRWVPGCPCAGAGGDGLQRTFWTRSLRGGFGN